MTDSAVGLADAIRSLREELIAASEEGRDSPMRFQIRHRGQRWRRPALRAVGGGSARRGRGIPSDRVVAIVARLGGGRVQVGSGYLTGDRQVLTAAHCTYDPRAGRAAASLRVVRRSSAALRTAIAQRLLELADGRSIDDRR